MGTLHGVIYKMKENKNIEFLLQRSQPEHNRSEHRLRYDHSVRIPKVTIKSHSKGIFGSKKVRTQELSLLDISPSGMCLISDPNMKQDFQLSEEVIAVLPSGVERSCEIRWTLNSLVVDEYECEMHAIGLRINEKLTIDEIKMI